MTAAHSPSGTTAKDQLARLLTLVPYLNDRGEMSVQDAAIALGVTPAQVVKDLRVLFMVGLPGGYPDDLIDVDLDALSGDGGGLIRVSNAGYLSRPVRLTSIESSALLVALSAMEEQVGAATREVIARLRAKLLLAAAGDGSAGLTAHDQGRELAAQVSEVRESLQKILDAGTQAEICYWVPSRDRSDERVISPHRLLGPAALPSAGAAGQWYLKAWCHQAQAPRLFRLDRIQQLRALDDPAVVEAGDEAAFEGSESKRPVTLRLEPPAQWVVEYFGVQAVRELQGADLEVDLEVFDPQWVVQLVRRLSPHAHILAPQEFTALSSAQARAILNLYQPDA